MAQEAEREVLLEFQRIGAYMKATAVDARTMTEVTVMGPANGSQEMLKRTVLAKLEYVLNRKGGRTGR